MKKSRGIIAIEYKKSRGMRHSYSDEMRVYDAMRYTQCVMFDATIAYF